MSDKASILVIDDEENIRWTLAKILQREGYGVATAATIKDAWACLQDNSYDLVFLDIKLPDANGLTVLPELRSRFPSTQVVVLTAQDKLDTALEAVDGGARDYLLKPIDPPDLLIRIQEILTDR
jgi:DNA-binding NtrC family response regulator